MALRMLLVDELKKSLPLLNWFPLGQERPEEHWVWVKQAEAGGS